MIDILIILAYFVIVMLVGVFSSGGPDTSAEEYFGILLATFVFVPLYPCVKIMSISQLYEQTNQMHLHLPADYPKWPWPPSVPCYC